METERLDGRTGLLQVGNQGVFMKVRVVDSRTAYGRLLCMVTPVAGVGLEWVNANRIMLDPIEEDTEQVEFR
jgi:hypothetical protein